MNFRQQEKQWENQRLAHYLDILDDEDNEPLESDMITFDTYDDYEEMYEPDVNTQIWELQHRDRR